MTELLRPWKLVTLAAGIGLLIAGSIFTPAPDWGIADSIVLAVFAYATAPLVFRWWSDRRWLMLPIGAYMTWMGSSGLYQAWWMLENPAALAAMGDAAIPANYALYLACGIFWAPRAPLRTVSWVRP